MLEIIHDIAPGAQLYFATALGGSANFTNNIRNLRAAGCDNTGVKRSGVAIYRRHVGREIGRASCRERVCSVV